MRLTIFPCQDTLLGMPKVDGKTAKVRGHPIYTIPKKFLQMVFKVIQSENLMTPSENKKSKKVVMVSGGFDPIHIGHIRMFEEAKKLGDELVVVVNNDNWLRYKKGYAFMPEEDRKEIIESLKSVDRVILTSHEPNTKDITACREPHLIRPDIFANGGDRK